MNLSFRTFFVFVIIFLLLNIFFMIFSFRSYMEAKNTHLESALIEQKRIWESTLDIHNNVVDIYFEDFVMIPPVLSILKEFKYADENRKSILRSELYKTVLKSYEILKRKGIRQFHFHTHDSKSLLRMHAPSRFKDSLVDLRPDVYKANKELKIVRGFEVGKLINGFRNVYPIIFNGDHLGSVEISFPFEVLIKTMMSRYEERGFMVLFYADSVKHISGNSYKRSMIDGNWMQEDTDGTIKLTEEQINLIYELRFSKSFIRNLNNGVPYALHKVLNNNHYIVTLMPIYSTNNKLAASLISLTPSPHLKAMTKRFYIINGILIFVAIIVSYIISHFYSIYKHNEEHEEYVSKVIETQYSCLYVMNEEGNTIISNSKLYEVLGYSKEELIGKSAHNLFHKHESDQFNCSIYSVIGTGIGYYSEEIFKKKNGEDIIVKVASEPLIYKGKKSAVVIFEDITKDKQQEILIRSINKRLSLVIDNATSGILFENYERKISIINNRFLEMFFIHFDKDYLVNRSRLELAISYSPYFKNPKDFVSRIEELVKNRSPFYNEIIETLDGKTLERDFIPVIVDDKTDGYLWIYRDITEKIEQMKKLEELQLQAEMANKAKSIFLANISHEIRTPLNGIICSLQLMKMDKNSPDQHYFEIIRSSSEHLLNIINDILDLSKIESGSIELEALPFKIEEIIRDTLNILGPTAESKGIDLNFVSDIPNGLTIKGDPHKMRQILLNLINNGIKFTPKGSVNITLSQKKLSMGVKIFISVKDTGIGITKDKMDRLFNPFSQVDVSHSRRFGGTGLGLAISKNLVELMGGKIDLFSEEGKGTEFLLEIPFEVVEVQEYDNNLSKIVDDRGDVDFSGLKALVVDDNEINRVIAANMLKKIGIFADVAPSGVECINILKDKDYDFIFMDVSMPEMDGFTTTKIIRSSDEVKNKNIPILAMTAYAFSEDREECLKSGMNGYISKPIHIDEIKKQLSTCLNLKKGVNYLQSEEKKSYEGCEQKLREFMNSDEEMHSLLSTYLNDAKIILKDIEDALISGDNLEKLSSLAHKIKGSSYNTGVDKVGEVAKNLEKSAKDGNITDVKLYIQKLKDELKSFEEWLIERLA